MLVTTTTGDAGAVLDALESLRSTLRHAGGVPWVTAYVPTLQDAEAELARLADENAQLREDYESVLTGLRDSQDSYDALLEEYGLMESAQSSAEDTLYEVREELHDLNRSYDALCATWRFEAGAAQGLAETNAVLAEENEQLHSYIGYLESQAFPEAKPASPVGITWHTGVS